MPILNGVKIINTCHSKNKWETPKQDICKSNSMIFKGNNTPDQMALRIRQNVTFKRQLM